LESSESDIFSSDSATLYLYVAVMSLTTQTKVSASASIVVFQVLLIVTGNRACVENISDSNVTTPLLLCLDSLPEGRAIVLDILSALVSNGNVVKQLLTKGNFAPFVL